MSATSKVKVGIVGSRFQADCIASAVKGVPEEAELVAVASPTRGHAAEFAKRHGIPQAYTDYHDLLRDPRVEMISITAPNRLHAAIAIDAAKAGKHVVCEKPLAMTSAQTSVLVAEAKATWTARRVRQHPGDERFFEHVEQFASIESAHALEHVELELPSDHGSEGQDAAARAGEPPQTSANDLSHTLGDHGASSASVLDRAEALVGGQQTRDLGHEERVSFRPGGDRGHDALGRADAGRLLDEERNLRLGETVQV